MAFQGYFKPKFPEKYKGNPKNIVYRSQWEFKYMVELDRDPNVLEWASEELYIPYISPKDKRYHRYFPDFVVKRKTSNGIIVEMIEIKPKAQTIAPKRGKKTTRKYLNEVLTYGVNINKWEAAEEYCKDRGWIFKVLTEKELGIK